MPQLSNDTKEKLLTPAEQAEARNSDVSGTASLAVEDPHNYVSTDRFREALIGVETSFKLPCIPGLAIFGLLASLPVALVRCLGICDEIDSEGNKTKEAVCLEKSVRGCSLTGGTVTSLIGCPVAPFAAGYNSFFGAPKWCKDVNELVSYNNVGRIYTISPPSAPSTPVPTSSPTMSL